tara:strand:+ start:2064 stop:2690 length:627 start_codon:yes stop_codon:yes gene_type:complete
MKYDPEAVKRWFADRGDYTHNVNYTLADDSVVIDLGGFKGAWADVLLEHITPVKPRIFLVEPVPEFARELMDKFNGNDKVTVINCGVSTDGGETNKDIYVSNDGSSTHYVCGPPVNIRVLPIEKLLADNGIDEVDLLQINIEGDEYGLLEHMLADGLITKFKNIQVQYHLGIENDRARRDKIRDGLVANGFKLKFDYPFVWEGWTYAV